MRAVFCGNLEYDARQSELERLFRKYGNVDRVDMKSGFAFVHMEDERDAADAIRGLDRFEFGRKGRRLCVEWTKQERGSGRRLESSRKPASNARPSKTLFVINFDPYDTRAEDLERHFDLYGKILNIRIRRNFAFIQFETQDEATKALDATNLSKLMDRVISVEYAMKDDDDKKPSYGMDRQRDRSPRRGYGHGRSPSPYARERGSPDYGHSVARRSPSPYGRQRASPDYGHRPRVHSISPSRKGRNSDYRRERSPIPRKEMVSHHRRDLSASPQRDRIPIPRNERASRHSRDSSASPRRERNSLEKGRGGSPPRKASPDYPSPPRKTSPDYHSPPRKASPNYPSLVEDDPLSPGEYRRSRSPDDRRGGGEESHAAHAPERSVSRSPLPSREDQDLEEGVVA